MKKTENQRGGKREGAGRPPEGKARYTVTLDEKNVTRAKAKEKNFSGLLDRLLAEWLGSPEAAGALGGMTTQRPRR